MSCACQNVPMGSYANQVALRPPWSDQLAGIDLCIADEILALWAAGVRTIESCCGHNQVKGYIAVPPEYEWLMEALGYARHPDNVRAFLPVRLD